MSPRSGAGSEHQQETNMNAITFEKDQTFGDEYYRGPCGTAKIIKGLSWDSYKWRVYFFSPKDLKADEWADMKTRKNCRELAETFVTKGYC